MYLVKVNTVGLELTKTRKKSHSIRVPILFNYTNVQHTT